MPDENHFFDTMSEVRGEENFPEIITSRDVKSLVKRAVGMDAEVVDYTVRPYSDEKIGFLGSHKRLVVTIKRKNSEANSLLSMVDFFVKALPYDIPTQAEYIREKGVFKQEAIFFGEVVPALARGFHGDPWTSQCYLIKDDCLVFEELAHSGFSMTDKLLNENEIRAGLSAIARLHAASLHAEARLERPLNEIYPMAFNEMAFVREGNQYRWYLAGVDLAVSIAEKLGLDASRLPEACDKVFDAMRPSRSKQNVASHGDLWSNNLMFNKNRPDQCRLVDFQLARYSPLGHDVAQFLYLCSSRSFRTSHGDAMLRHYYECLRDCLENKMKMTVKIPAWREVEQGYNEQRLAAAVTATIYFPTVLLDGRRAAEIMNDSESYKKYVMVDRREPVLGNMERDPQYRSRINETIAELVEFSLRLEELPEPC